MASVTPVVTDAATLEEAIDVLQEHVPMEMEGDFQPETLFEILVHAASNAESIPSMPTLPRMSSPEASG